MITSADRIDAANRARRDNTERMLQRIQATLRQMRRDRAPIVVAAVARRAEVSRAFLYQNAQAKEMLAEAVSDASRDAGPGSEAASRNDPWKDRALNAEDALKVAYDEITNQRAQIGRLLGHIRDLEADLPADAVERLTVENRTLREANRELTQDRKRLTERLSAARDNNRFLDTRIAALEAEIAESVVGRGVARSGSGDHPGPAPGRSSRESRDESRAREAGGRGTPG